MDDNSKPGAPLLALAAAVGLGAAIFASFSLEKPTLTKGVLVEVGGSSITEEDLALALVAFEADSKFAATEAERAAILDRLVDEALLVERGVELGLPRSESNVRKAMVQAMIKLAIDDTAPPSEADLVAFYGANLNRFTPPPLYKLVLYVGTEAEIAAASQQISAGADPDDVASALRDTSVPNEWLTASNVAAYVGPTLLSVLQNIDKGDITGAVDLGKGRFAIMWLTDLRKSQTPDFAMIRDQVSYEWRREADDKALEDYIAGLRQRYDISKAASK